MTAKQYLSQIAHKQRMIAEAQEKADALRIEAESVGAIRYDKDNVQTSPTGDALTNYVIRMTDAETRVLALKENCLAFTMTVWEQIESLHAEGNYKDILYLRYVKCMKLRDVAELLSYEYTWTCKLHGKALQVFGQQYGPF